jgi:hypothetical protein
MPRIPIDTKWYLAELVMEFDVAGERPLVHVNTTLIRADSPDEAYQKARHFGEGGESEYTNTDGNSVRIKFRGLRNLLPIYETLEDGAEILYEEISGLSNAEISKLVRDKSELAIFQHDRQRES